MKYKIDWAEKKTWQDKTYLVTTLIGEDGVKHDKVSIWPDFPGFEELAPGRDAEGTLVTNAKGYKSLKGGNGTPGRATTRAFGFNMEKAALEKRDFIKTTIDEKEKSIRLAACMRDATLIITSLYTAEELTPLPRTDVSKEKIIQDLHQKWVAYLLEAWGQERDADNIPY